MLNLVYLGNKNELNNFKFQPDGFIYLIQVIDRNEVLLKIGVSR